MKKIKAYEGVVERALGSRHYALAKFLKGQVAEQQIEILTNIFLEAANDGEDEIALDYYKLLGQFFLDIEMTPFLVEKEGVLLEPNCSRDEFQEIFNRANSAIAKKTMELYPQIAGFKVNEFGKYIKDEERWGRGPSTAQLIETKKAMLEYVASQWRNTTSDAEANSCFLFLWAAYACVFFSDERNICVEEIRKATREGFSPVRLIRHRLLLTEPDLVFGQRDDDRKALEKILMHAWVNNSDSKDITNLLRAVKPVLEIEKDIYRHEDDKAPWVLLGHVSEETARLHKAVKELINAMQPEGWAEHKVPGDIKISYLDRNCVKISVEISIADPLYFQREKMDPEEMGRENFELAESYIIEWTEMYAHFFPVLSLSIKWKNGGIPLFFHEHSYGG